MSPLPLLWSCPCAIPVSKAFASSPFCAILAAMFPLCSAFACSVTGTLSASTGFPCDRSAPDIKSSILLPTVSGRTLVLWRSIVAWAMVYQRSVHAISSSMQHTYRAYQEQGSHPGCLSSCHVQLEKNRRRCHRHAEPLSTCTAERPRRVEDRMETCRHTMETDGSDPNERSFRIVQERAKTIQRFMTEAQTILLNGCDMSAPLAMFLTMWCWFRASAAARTMVKCVSKVERRAQRAVALPVMSLSGQPSHQGFSQDGGVRSMIDGPAIGSFGGG